MSTKTIVLLLTAAVFLAACGQTGEREEGIEVGTSAVNEKSAESQAKALASDAQASGEVIAKHDHGDTTVQSFYRDDGRKIDLQKGFLNLFPVELVPCGVARFKPFDAILPRAYAHAGEEHPVDASVIDVSLADGTLWPLGELSATPGRYCGLRVAVVPVTSSTAAPDEVDMSGSGLYVAPCYFYDDADPTQHYCFSLSVAGGSEELLLPFDAPLELNRERRHAELSLHVVYDRWFDGLDLDGYPASGTTEEKAAFKAGLQANAGLKQQLLDNVLDSLHLTVD